MLMAMSGLFKAGLVEWITAMTYQAASGAGAAQMRELVQQMGVAHQSARTLLDDPSSSITDIDRTVSQTLRSASFPVESLGQPLAGSLLPWIDKDLGNGQSREEWKGMAETNKILGCAKPRARGRRVRARGRHALPQPGAHGEVDARCPARRDRTHPLRRNEWVKVVPNQREATLRELTPATVSGTLSVPIGRLRKLPMGGDYLTAFTVGDQLLWGAAEPLRRMLRIVLAAESTSARKPVAAEV